MSSAHGLALMRSSSNADAGHFACGTDDASALAAATERGRREARDILATGSKSFALAGLLLGKRTRDDAAVLYAWCRRADDVIDEPDGRTDDPRGAGDVERRLRDLSRSLDDLYARRVRAPLELALCELIVRRGIPREYFQALLDGFAMDAKRTDYATLSDLDLYAYRVAGVVGLMMCHVLGIRDARFLPSAAHLGMAMQLTNIARDVAEDAERGRQYLPKQWIGGPVLTAALTEREGSEGRRQVARAVRLLLVRADDYYRSGLRGLRALDARSAVAIGAAARIYRAIGRVLARRKYDPLRGRAAVSLPGKILLIAIATVAVARQLPARLGSPRRVPIVPPCFVRFDDVQTGD